MTTPRSIDGPPDWLRLVLGLFVVFGLFHWSATFLRSDRGQPMLVFAARKPRR